jgi:hypothetical protein
MLLLYSLATYEAVDAKDALIDVVANELDKALVANELDNAVDANEAVVAKDALNADDAKDAVPDKDPENIAVVSVFVVALNVNVVESTRTALFPVVPSVNAT